MGYSREFKVKNDFEKKALLKFKVEKLPERIVINESTQFTIINQNIYC